MRKNSEAAYTQLPRFEVSPEGPWTGLRIDGMVAEPAVFSLRELESMPVASLVQDFRDSEGWPVPPREWEGVELADLFRVAGPLRDARYARCSAAGYSANLTIEEAIGPGALVALRLNGGPLSEARGGPCRLVAPTLECFFSVKRLERIEITAVPLPVTARRLASERLIRAGR